MNDIFGRVTAILIAVATLFGMPLVYMQERQKTAAQMYLLAESTRFVDSVCNTGFLSQEMMRQFYQGLIPVQGVCEVRLLHETKELAYVQEEDTYEQVSAFYDEEDIREKLERGEDYVFARNDFLRITILVKGGLRLLPWQEDDTQNICYGGVVKYEAY